MTTVRDRMVSEALSVQGYRAADPQMLPLFRELLGPGSWDLARPYQCTRTADGGYRTSGVSTCGLVAAGLLRRVVSLPWDGFPYWHYPAPYAGLDIVSALSLLGQLTGSRRAAGQRPVPGDAVCIGSGLSTHVFTVVDDDGRTITSIDGGAVDDAAHGFLQRVRLTRRQWPGPRVVWVLDLDRLHAVLGDPGQHRIDLTTTAGLQEGLRRLGYTVAVDGVMGPQTRAAVRAFQSHEGLVPDGIVGPITRGVMESELERVG